MFNGGCEILQSSPVQTLQTSSRVKQKAFVKIIEQPAPKALRFRYLCEGRSAGSIPGVSSTQEKKTYPAIQVVGYQGRAVVVVSCVTKDEPYRPHPYNLVGRDGCKRGVCTLNIPTDTMSIQFENLGIQCVKKKEIESSLRLREEIRVDPFRTGFSHRNLPTSIDLNSVRLCFQVFLEGDKKGKFTEPLKPVVSEPVYDKKTSPDLVIVELSHCVSPADGGSQIILLCEKINKEDIQIRFYEEQDGMLLWEDYGKFQSTRVHKQVAISFEPPKYYNLGITDPVKVFIQLKRPSDGATSEPLPFNFIPGETGNRKRKRFNHDSLLTLNQVLRTTATPFVDVKMEPRATPTPFVDVKMEPRDNAYQWAQRTAVYIPNIFGNPPNIQGASALPPITWNLPFLPNLTAGQIQPSTHNLLDTNCVPNLTPFATQPTQTNELDSGRLRSLLNLDSHNTELRQITISSGDLASFEANLDVANLSGTLNTNLPLTDIQVDQNNGDGMTRFANHTIDSICQGTNTFK